MPPSLAARNPGNVIKTGKQAHNGNIAPAGPALDSRFRGNDTGGKTTGWILNNGVILQGYKELFIRTLRFATGITEILEPILKAIPTFTGTTPVKFVGKQTYSDGSF